MKKTLWILFALVFTFVLGQNCAKVSFEGISTNESTPAAQQSNSGNGGTYDGKLRILHHYVNNFTCEGKKAPESILTRGEDLKWYYTQNTPEKCKSITKLEVSEVQYNETQKQAYYKNQLYVPPKVYTASTINPNSPDVDLEDGLCENAQGLCSLNAALQQAVVTALTEEVQVKLSPGTYSLTAPLIINQKFSNIKKVIIDGQDQNATVLDGNNQTHHIHFFGFSTTAMEFKNLKFTRGQNNTAFQASSIFIDSFGNNSNLIIDHCRFENNNGINPVISTWYKKAHIIVQHSQFSNNNSKAIQINGASEFKLLNSEITGHNNTAVDINNYTQSATIESSSIYNNLRGIAIQECFLCQVINSSVFHNDEAGVDFKDGMGSTPLTLQILNTTLYQNALVQGANLKTTLDTEGSHIELNNSIISQDGLAKPNCLRANSINSQILAHYSLIDDASCLEQGDHNLNIRPQLNPPTKIQEGVWSLIPQATSPVIDTGQDALCPQQDQRGIQRPINKNPASVNSCDMGSVELE